MQGAIENCNAEEWRPVVGFEGVYEASSDGCIKRVIIGPGGTKGGNLTLYREKRGYYHVHLAYGPKRKFPTVHSVVAVAFIGPRPPGYHINHIDGDKSNNRLENLEYVTPQANIAHAVRLKLHTYGERNGRAKLSEADVAAVRALSGKLSQAKLGAKFGVSKATIYYVLKGIRWRHLL